MSKNLPTSFPSHFPKSRKEESEFGKGKKDIVICKKCNAVYFYKSWHHQLEEYSHIKEDKKLKFILCPACQMIKDKKYEGEVIMENIPLDLRKNIVNTIKNVGKEAFKRNSQSRIIYIKEIEKNKKIRVLTTENQLAVRIGKKIKSAYHPEMKIQYAKKESTIEVKLFFKGNN